jgi:BirA family transcriptional regulator, biotin operon repressor / biotin---[acetyl-CoA-carboxylase] ligase
VIGRKDGRRKEWEVAGTGSTHGSTWRQDLAQHPAVVAACAEGSRGTRFHHLVEVTSTNDVALERMRDAASVGLVVVADGQTAGRGRAGRGWVDAVQGPAGPSNLAVTATVAVRAEQAVGAAPLAAGLAVADAFRDAGAAPALKWPNDVLLDDRKACGILVERHDLPTGAVLLIGCGLDLDWRGVPREGEAAGWTSLAEALDAPIDRGAVLGSLLTHLDRRLHLLERDPAALLTAYREACTTIGRAVRVVLPGGTERTGVARDLDGDGHLVVATDEGSLVVRAGDVVHLRPDPS